MDRSGWDPVVSGLRRRFRLVLIDNRGSGGSGVGRDRFKITDMADDVAAVLDHAGIERAHVLGASLGGMVAQQMAARHPARVERLVLVCTTPGWPFAYPMPVPSVELLAARPLLSEDVALRRTVENALSAKTVQHSPDLVERLVAHHQDRPVDPDAWSAQMSAGAGYFGNLDQAHIQARTLVIHGTGDRVVDHRNAKLLADRIPNSELVLLPDLGHMFWWEDPESFVTQVSSFVEQADDVAANAS